MTSDIVEKVKSDLMTAIDKDKLVLPTLPEVALKVREIAENPDSAINDLVTVISNDTALTARLIKVCNSPLFRGSREITNLAMAVSRLGMAYTSNLATGLAMEQMFQATTEQIDVRLRDTWQRSTEIAGIAYVLAQHYTKLKPDQATLAGLVHLIGALPILRYIEDNDVKITGPMLDSLIKELHPKVGARILEKWDFPKELRSVPSDFSRFDREVPAADYADLVTVASLQLDANTQQQTETDYSHVKAFKRLGIDPSGDTGEDLSAEMESAMALLNG